MSGTSASVSHDNTALLLSKICGNRYPYTHGEVEGPIKAGFENSGNPGNLVNSATF
ncbi:1428_t:CDS:2 [Cetraspora pellucida]|uniref:1428_t:CDS:1 n=1 Tax=Cetraspora pellucida TaxID=1433469 RepID=A0ACA9K2Y2_9GLOM|nr:1428_t:CDS:2 [Cetraspora pellucida]